MGLSNRATWNNRDFKRNKNLSNMGVGKNTSALLSKYGIFSAYQLSELDNLWIKKVLG